MSYARQPRVAAYADGAALAGVMEAEVTSASHGTATCFSLRLALGAGGGSLAGWAARSQALIDVQFWLDGGWTSLVTGQADSIEADPIGGTLRIAGRDLSAQLIEARTAESFANQTASDVAATLAARHGLAAQITPTTTPIGRYYGTDHTGITLGRLSRQGTEWGLLAALAEQEGMDVAVAGTTLVFGPAPAAQPALLSAADFTSLRLHRCLLLAQGVQVTVRSWNSQTHSATVQSVDDGGPAPRRYSYTRPNLAPDAAAAYARTRLAAITRHGLQLAGSMPGELALAPRGTMVLAGTGSNFDTAYTIDRIVRRISVHGGFVQTVDARAAIGNA